MLLLMLIRLMLALLLINLLLMLLLDSRPLFGQLLLLLLLALSGNPHALHAMH